ncbi:PHD finger protein 14-like [Pollicipes pollicipes]|uniref:PHD finger protein 14-like n=1 Tax=Pollicipes pollicipes TaxID=41117 RepID=UPI0018857E9A|nr:PHD finger protein 14-like [Pollicipes pollicipes]
MPGKIDAVGFLIKSMVERDPSKRRVKPSQQALQEFEGLELEDSSDDSDYKVDEKEDDDEDDVDSNFSGDDNDEDKNNDDSGSDDSSNEADAEQDAEVTVSELLTRAGQSGPGAGAGQAVKRIKICSICLGDRSSDQNEIVECDGCHVTVHEGCNGVSESHSVSSSASSDPTEPWFCDACRAGATRFECDLCPNTGGLLKETDTGRWVHLVCALYVPGVAFGDVDRLTSVTLFEIPYTRWGGKACSVCEDTSLSRTGVTIQCDAGMCKAAFHVTCAQRNGLLQEPRIDEEAADPYFAHCKLHTDKAQIRERKRNYLAMRLYQRQEHPDKMEPARLRRKLGRLQLKYRTQRETRKVKWTPTMKLARPITSSPYLLRCLQRRAALMGVDLDQGQHAAGQLTDVSKKWHLPPAFSVEFISYFLDRGQRMAAMTRSLKELMTEKATLQEQENLLRSQYAEMESSLSTLRQAGDEMRAVGLRLHRQLAGLSGGKLKLPPALLPPRLRKVSGRGAVHRLSPAKPALHGGSARLTLHECIECGASSGQHLLVLCDTCHHHYHLGCLEPPLTRMPRKSKTAGWEYVRTSARGGGKESVKDDDLIMSKFLTQTETPCSSVVVIEKLDETMKKKPRRQQRSKAKVRAAELLLTQLDGDGEPGSDEGREHVVEMMTPMKMKEACTTPAPCSNCGGPGDDRTLVRCDDCARTYHLSCLVPPVTKSPKRPGYGWLCGDCAAKRVTVPSRGLVCGGRLDRLSPISTTAL